MQPDATFAMDGSQGSNRLYCNNTLSVLFILFLFDKIQIK